MKFMANYLFHPAEHPPVPTLEQPELTGLDRDVLDEIFAVLVRDFSAYATELHGRAATTEEQAAWALAHVRRPVADPERTARMWALSGAYEMRP